MAAHTSKECRLCHRVGSRNFVPSGDYGWVCALGRACTQRVARRLSDERRAALAGSADDTREETT